MTEQTLLAETPSEAAETIKTENAPPPRKLAQLRMVAHFASHYPRQILYAAIALAVAASATLPPATNARRLKFDIPRSGRPARLVPSFFFMFMSSPCYQSAIESKQVVMLAVYTVPDTYDSATGWPPHCS